MRSTSIILGLVFIAVLFAGCKKEPTYQESINARAMPKTKEAKQNECLYIRQEIANMQSTYHQASLQKCNPRYGVCIGPVIMAKSNRNIATLENRASVVGCDSAFSSTTVISNTSSSIDECISACKKNTTRTSTECFDTCNK